MSTSSDTTVPRATSPFAVRGVLATLTDAARARLFDRGRAADAGVETAVRTIIDDVRSRGDAALRDLALRFDHARLDALEVPRDECERALRDLDRAVRNALEHRSEERRVGKECGSRWL